MIHCYATNHEHSRVVCSAFAQGHEAKIVPPAQLLDGPAFVHGILRGCGDIMKQCEWIGRDYFYCDHGYFNRGYYEGHFRIVRNERQTPLDGSYMSAAIEFTSKRWGSLGINLQEWQKTGKNVLICPISRYVGDYLGIDAAQWTKTVVAELSRHTDRPIAVKPKDGIPLETALKDAHCLVTHSSNAAIDAIVAGVPVITLGVSAAQPVSWSFEDIEAPHYPEREPWAHVLAHHQFTLDEMRRGIDLESL